MIPTQDLVTLLLSATLSVALVLFSSRILVRAGKSYRDSQTVVKAIITTYGQRLTRQEELCQAVSNEVEHIRSSLKRMEDSLVGSRIGDAHNLGSLTELIPVVNEVSLNIRSLNETLKLHAGEVLEAAPALRMKSCEVMADFSAKRNQLSPIELQTLKILSEDGPKSSSELRPRIGRSREHFARLMKRLYERGYVDRDATKTPFVYTINCNITGRVVQKEGLSTV